MGSRTCIRTGTVDGNHQRRTRASINADRSHAYTDRYAETNGTKFTNLVQTHAAVALDFFLIHGSLIVSQVTLMIKKRKRHKSLTQGTEAHGNCRRLWTNKRHDYRYNVAFRKAKINRTIVFLHSRRTCIFDVEYRHGASISVHNVVRLRINLKILISFAGTVAKISSA